MRARGDATRPHRVRAIVRDAVAVLWSGALLAVLLVPGATAWLAELPLPVLAALAILALVSGRRVVVKVMAYARVIPKARRNRLDLTKHLLRRPAIGIADLTYEAAALMSSSVDHRLKYLASAKVSSRIGCPF